ncbi:MAG: hypoxanthine phosphoribosyltransferase [Deltaproteobacteria bacterium]|jgi:hypoxanthine phosphoribosyltransferase|nr:hypoxanthine phosphoribosyltransferase [Deltaproteobacteria bacterium]
MTTPELVPVLTKEEIQQKIIDIAGIISKDYAGKELLLIGILKGSFIFLSDLVRHLSIPAKIDFIRASSYGNTISSSGTITLTQSVQIDVRNKHLLLVEDIVDTGLTLSSIMDYFRLQGAASIKICAFIDKYERREANIPVDYSCHTTHEGFLVGYGLDYAENYRGLPGVYHLKI